MEAKFETLQILCQIDDLEQTLNTFIYGSIEIREKSKKKYIYIHNRYGKKTSTTFVGEYSEATLNEIKANNQRAKDIKKEIKRLRKELETINYQEIDLADEVKQNIDFARKEIVNTIYKQALLEGVNTTHAQTQAIIEGGKVKNMSVPDILKIINLKRAWDFILDKNIIASETDYYLLSEINKYILDGFYY
ncbi:MAG: hypothetical protein LUD22_03140, partial [Coprobacillus sp.]|nr:hypothetical protein [Coprobacillus sp.]